MWQTKHIDDVKYLISVEHNMIEQKFFIFISTLEELWISELSDTQVKLITKQLNPLIEVDETDVITEIVNLFDTKRKDVEWSIETDQDQLKLNLNSTYEGIKFVFQATLGVTDNKTYFQTIVLPLLITIRNLQYQRDQLCKFLRKKDIEIAEYKMNGASVTRKNIETAEFNEDILRELFSQHLPHITSKNPKDLFDVSVISCCNEIQAVSKNMKQGGENLHESAPKEDQSKSNEIIVPVKCHSSNSVTEIKKPEEVTATQLITAFQKSKSIARKQSKPIKRLKNL